MTDNTTPEICAKCAFMNGIMSHRCGNEPSEVRPIDANALKEAIRKLPEWYGDDSYYSGINDVSRLIDNAPTVEPEITEEQAIDKLRETGWLPKHDKEMTERPHGEITDEDIQNAIKQGYNDGYEMAKAKYERPQGKWIDANKQIPDDCITVLIWFEYYRYGDYNCMYQTFGLGYTIDGKWSPFINGETGWRDAHIIAWQPIEPYEADMRGGGENE